MKSFLRDFFPRRRRRKPHVRPWALAAPVAVLLFCLPLLRPLRHPDADSISDDEALRLATIAALVENPPIRGQAPAFRLAIDTREFPNVRRTIVAIASPAGPPVAATASTSSSAAPDAGRWTATGQERVFSGQPPVMAFILSGPYYLMHAMGLRLKDSVLAAYLLTVIGATLPAAAVAGLAYRMGRLFELRRPARAGLAIAVVFGSGLVTYGVVLNSHAPAAALAFGAVGCLVQIGVSREPARAGGWLAAAGFCAALAAAIDPVAIVFPVLLILVVPLMPWSAGLRLIGILLFLLGAAPPIILHGILTVPITGNLLPGFMHPELARRPIYLAEQAGPVTLPTGPEFARTDGSRPGASRSDVARADTARTDIARTDIARTDVGQTDTAGTDAAGTDNARTDPARPLTGPYEPVTFSAVPSPDYADDDSVASPDFRPAPADPDDVDEDSPPTFVWLRGALRWAWRVMSALVGSHGIFSHFPIVVFGLIGIGAIVRRHWPATTKALASITAAAGVVVVLGWATAAPDNRSAMFANRWFVLFLPLTIYWAGAWLRRRHSITLYAIAGVLLAISMTISIIGATDPMPRGGYTGYTALAALRKPPPAATPSLLAGG